MVESFNYEEKFPQIVSRAFSSGVDTLDKTRHLISSNGRYLIMKGANVDQENLQKLSFKIHSIQVPFVSDKRSLLEINI